MHINLPLSQINLTGNNISTNLNDNSNTQLSTRFANPSSLLPINAFSYMFFIKVYIV